jgi:hypothetical protein
VNIVSLEGRVLTQIKSNDTVRLSTYCNLLVISTSEKETFLEVNIKDGKSTVTRENTIEAEKDIRSSKIVTYKNSSFSCGTEEIVQYVENSKTLELEESYSEYEETNFVKAPAVVDGNVLCAINRSSIKYWNVNDRKLELQIESSANGLFASETFASALFAYSDSRVIILMPPNFAKEPAIEVKAAYAVHYQPPQAQPRAPSPAPQYRAPSPAPKRTAPTPPPQSPKPKQHVDTPQPVMPNFPQAVYKPVTPAKALQLELKVSTVLTPNKPITFQMFAPSSSYVFSISRNEFRRTQFYPKADSHNRVIDETVRPTDINLAFLKGGPKFPVSITLCINVRSLKTNHSSLQSLVTICSLWLVVEVTKSKF